MLHHYSRQPTVINKSASKRLRKVTITTHATKAMIVQLKKRGIRAVEIAKATGASESIIQKTWTNYMAANPSQKPVPRTNGVKKPK